MGNPTIAEMQQKLYETHQYFCDGAMVLESRPILVSGSTDKERARKFAFSLQVGVDQNGLPVAIQGEIEGAETLAQALKALPEAIAKRDKEMREEYERAKREQSRIIVPGVTVGNFGTPQ